MSVNSFFSSVEGVQCGLMISEVKRIEDSVKAGENTYLTALFQTYQGHKSVGVAEKALEAAGMPIFSWAGKAVVYVTPALLGVLKNSTFIPDCFRSVIAFFQENISNLYLIATVVSSVALLFFGQIFFAVSALLFLGIGFMDRNGLLPVEMRKFLHEHSKMVIYLTSLVAGGIIDKIFVLLNVVLLFVGKFCAKKHDGQNFVLKQNLTPQLMEDFLNGQVSAKINREFIHYNPFPPVPDIDIQSLVGEFDQIDWQKHLPALRQKLKIDPRFVARYRDPALKSDQELIDFAKHSLETCITSIKEKRVLAGEPADYEKLHNYLKLIAKHLETQQNEIERTDILLRLAIEGGEYCGPGKFEVIESIYAQTVGENPEIPLSDKIAYCLQDERNLWMQGFYSRIAQNQVGNTVGKVIDWHDIHNYNRFLSLHGDEFGLRKAAADNDDSTMIDSAMKWIMGRLSSGALQDWFWREHTLYDQTQTVIDSIGTPKLPKPEVYEFWWNWIDRQEIETEAKAALQEELADGTLYGAPIERNGRMTYEFATLMLLDMGIAEIEPLQTNEDLVTV